MSDLELSYESDVEINGQKISIKTEVSDGFKQVDYILKSETPMEPLMVALSLYVMCIDVCKKLNIEIDDLKEGMIEPSSESIRERMN